MSDNTPNDTRDASGRFVKQAAETAHRLHTPSEDGVHPISKILFGWTEAEITGTAIFWGVGILSAFLIVVDLAVDRHEYVHMAEATGFYALWGFAAFAFVVLMGWPLGGLLRRSEDYYGDPGGPPADIDPDVPAAPDTSPTYPDEGDEL
ncbi:hypothetical protein [Hyphomonas atlantica corrig.]|uniref:hypothetical protein n=1 Tax=Hyphomonas atlantica TaxID=1280948 RepID=UPI0023571240|nr:hypothetical protein [Hyphomonas atlantica]